MIHQGKIVLMGSGELTETMVEVHKAMLRSYGKRAKAVFMDTPAGFQLNADAISQKAVEYFRTHVQHPLSVSSFKSSRSSHNKDALEVFKTLRSADYLFIGPGSPTYALRQWRSSPIPQIWLERLATGACLAAASAAALAVGRLTLPVYEIYKVGEPPHWVPGLNIIEAFGLNAAVVPHWNNAEGGNHDTRFCFLGEERLLVLEDQMPEDVDILGIDEHTALIIDARKQTAHVRGRGTVTLRRKGLSRVFKANETIELGLLQQETIHGVASAHLPATSEIKSSLGAYPEEAVWDKLGYLIEQICQRVTSSQAEEVNRAMNVLALQLRKGREDTTASPSEIQSLEIIERFFVNIEHALASKPQSWEACLSPLMEEIIDLRQRFRSRKEWQAADEVRDCLQRAKVILTDTAEGTLWHKLD